MMKRKQLYKSIIILLILSLLVPVLGLAETGEENQLNYSLEDLISLAINNSSELKSSEYQKEATYDTLSNVGSMTRFVPAADLSNNVSSAVSVYKLYKNYDIAYDLSKKTMQIEKDKVRNNVIQDFYSIQNIEKEINTSKLNLDYKKNMMDIAKLKYNMGMSSTIEKKSFESQYLAAKDSYDLLLSERNKLYANLNTLTGLSSSLEYNLIYEDIANIEELLTAEDGDYFVSRNSSSSLILEMSEKRLELSKLNVDYFAFNDPTNPKTYNATKNEYQADVSSIETTKDGISKFSRETFYSLLEIQDNYKKLLEKNKIDNDLHQVKKIQYDLGMITKNDLLESEITLLENQSNLSSLKSAFNQLMFILNHPHVQLA